MAKRSRSETLVPVREAREAGRGGARQAAVEAAADERLVERAVRELRALVVQGQLDLVSAVGEYLIANFYGSMEEARSRRPRKPASLAALASRAGEFGMTSSGLRTAVPLALQVRELGAGLARRLSPTHHLALLPMRDSGEKKVLARAAADAGWSVDELRRERERLQQPHPGGRPPAPRLRQAVSRAARALAPVPADDLRAGLEEIAAPEVRRLLVVVERMQAELERWEKLLVRQLERAPAGRRTDGGGGA